MYTRIFGIALLLLLPILSVAQGIAGTYKLLTFKSTFDDGSFYEPLGNQPSGYVIITQKRFMAVLAASDRKPGRSTEEQAALLRSLIAYTGPYRIIGNRLITDVDISWNQTWTGVPQGRTWTVEGNQLILVTDKAPSIQDPSKLASARLVWERIE